MYTEPGRAHKKIFDAVYVILTHPTFLDKLKLGRAENFHFVTKQKQNLFESQVCLKRNKNTKNAGRIDCDDIDCSYRRG